MPAPSTEMTVEEKRALARQLLARKSGPAKSGGSSQTHQRLGLEDDPGVKMLALQKAELARLGLANPYFRGHETVSGDTVVMGGRSFVNFSGYNYLGLSGHPDVTAAVQDAVARFGSSTSASRVASGEIPLHDALEQGLADFVGAEAAICYVSGYGTNVSTLGHLFGPEDLILHDALIHNSALIGAQLSGARRQAFRHNDMSHLEELLRAADGQHRRVLIVAEGVYSMDGDIAPLAELAALKARYNAVLMIDEAHSLGILGATGRGLGEMVPEARSAVDLWMGTLSKSLASCGGYIAGKAAVIEYLKYNAPGFVYSVGLSPADTAAALSALNILCREPERVARVQARAARFLSRARAAGLDTGPSSGSAVVPIVTGSSGRALQLAAALEADGVNVQPIFYPAVEENAARLRFFVSALHSDEQIDHTVERTAAHMARLNASPALHSPIFGGGS